MTNRSPSPGASLHGTLLLQTAGVCHLDPPHLIDVFGDQRQRFVSILQGFGPADWAAPTRCADWSAHDVVRHLCDGTRFAIAAGAGDRTLDITAAVASMLGDPVRQKLALSGDGGGIFDLDSRGAVTLTVTHITTTGPPAAQVTDALAGRAPRSAVLGDLPASTRTALSHLADFFNTPVEQRPA